MGRHAGWQSIREAVITRRHELTSHGDSHRKYAGLQAPDSTSAFAAAGADQDPFLDSWASGFLRDPGRGDPWEVSGPAVTSDKPPAGGIQLNNGGSITLSAAPYTNEIDVFGETPDVMQTTFAGHVRLSDANGHDYTAAGATDFCMLLTGCDCPNSDEPPPLPLEGDAVALAVTGGPTGTSGTLSGTSLDDFCNRVSGTWNGTWSNSPDFGTPPATGTFIVTLTQRGSTLTGVSSVSGPTCISGGMSTGTVTGNKIQFGFLADPQRPLTFEGTVTGNTMSGTWSTVTCGKVQIPIYGTWTATKASGASAKP